MPIEASRLGLIAAVCLLAPLAGRAQEPLSAIDWLSQSVATPAPAPVDPARPTATTGATQGSVAVTVIGAPSADAVGLLPPQVTGLPANLWGPGQTEDIAALLTAERVDSLPALRGLLLTVLLAEAQPPADAGTGATLLMARIDKLLAMGALDQARALLDAAGSRDPGLFRRSFDVALLTGEEDRGCRIMVESPGLAPTFPARIFCLARSGDWNAAALTLRTGQALGYITDEEDALLSRFLDPDLFEGEPPLATPSRITPLAWRMFEAIGEPLSTATLPIAFAHAELRPQAGWKAQVEAAERLARAGAISPNALLGLYTERRPAASGGVWDRVAVFQKFEAALDKGDQTAIAQILPEIWAQMTQSELEVPFADLYGKRLSAIPFEGEAAQVAFALGLLSPDFESIVASRKPTNPREAFLIGLAQGRLDGLTPPDSLARAIAPAFLGHEPDADLSRLVEEGRIGEAILIAIEKIERGVQGDLDGVTDGLALLRKVGMDKAARRTALELVLLERRG
ncbi:hypothetical protein C0V75_07125 [Tabrizicola sp. TH137]|uniref:hypothetical protein n=1 Tax=Tabrizicola sp. TH137 TaxID=2067452 RepID=UPI000C7A6796|nr:hypothetical protein [Tabrizicola sp. TH137]PLL13177.1 hypothetical protein C0V75_07125 [Tabrizicola sp. TH137]